MRNIILIILLSLPTFTQLLRHGFFPMHDDMQAMRLLEMDKCIKDGQIPCRWVPDMGFGYGYPQFNYYAPLPYYAMEAIHLLGLGYLDSVKAGFIVSLLLGLVGMYLLGKSLFGEYAGILSALFYTYMPYRAVNMYVRGAMGELWGMAFVPFVFWSAFSLFKGDKKSIIWFALSLSALFVSHNITAAMTVPFLILWFFVLMIIYKSEFIPAWKKILVGIFIGFLWAAGLSAFFVFPAWMERNLVHIETLTAGYFKYINHFVGLKQLLFSNYWGYGTSEVGDYDELLLSVGLWYWLIPLIGFLIFLFLRKKESLIIAFFIILGWISLFLIHPRSQFIWDKIGILKFFQFPWRFLALSGFLFSLAAGALAALINKTRSFFLFTFLPLLILLLIFYSSFFRAKEWIEITDDEKFSGKEWIRQQTVSIYDYLPIYVKRAPDSPASVTPSILENGAYILEGVKGTDWQKYKILVLSDLAKLQFPLYYFPNWRVEVDKKIGNYSFDNDFGLITLALVNGEHDVSLRLVDTPIRSASNIITLASLVAIPLYLAKKKKDEN